MKSKKDLKKDSDLKIRKTPVPSPKIKIAKAHNVDRAAKEDRNRANLADPLQEYKTGNWKGRQFVAKGLTSELKKREVNAKCMSMDDYDFDRLSNETMVYFVCATCGQGEFPANSQNFWEQLSNPTLPNDLLANTKFAVFGLGDSSYVYYNYVAEKVDGRLFELGAKRAIKAGLGDELDEEKYETTYSEWLPEVFNELQLPEPPRVVPQPLFHVNTLDSTSTMKIQWAPPGTTLIKLIKNELLTPEGYDRDIRHYEFDIAGTGMNYSIGDSLGLYPNNEEHKVEQFLDKIGVDPNKTLQLTSSDPTDLPTEIPAKQLFTEAIDIFGRPNRRFYDFLSLVATDPKEQQELNHLLTKEGKDILSGFIKATDTYADILEKFPSSIPSINYLIEYIPQIKPRLYSIASSIEAHPGELHLLIILDDWETPAGKYRTGLCSNWLRHNNPEQSIFMPGRVNPAAINVADNHKSPCIMAGLGTGLAPFRAMVEDRHKAKLEGEKTAPMALFYGARNKKAEFSYQDELESYHDNGNGVLTNLSTAFSRDQAQKIYVQDRITESGEMIYDYLYKQNGYFYYCGTGGRAPAAVRKAIVQSFNKYGGHSLEEAEEIITKLQISGKYNVEAW